MRFRYETQVATQPQSFVLWHKKLYLYVYILVLKILMRDKELISMPFRSLVRNNGL